jgi:hypothetical protein
VKENSFAFHASDIIKHASKSKVLMQEMTTMDDDLSLLGSYTHSLATLKHILSSKSSFFIEQLRLFTAENLAQILRFSYALTDSNHALADREASSLATKNAIIRDLQTQLHSILEGKPSEDGDKASKSKETEETKLRSGYFCASNVATVAGEANYQLWRQLEQQRLMNLNSLLLYGEEFMACVTVTVLEARDLLWKDVVGMSSDPYCIISFDHDPTTYRSPTIARNLNPVFNYTAKKYVSHANSEVLIQIFDDDYNRKKNDFLGMVVVSLERIREAAIAADENKKKANDNDSNMGVSDDSVTAGLGPTISVSSPSDESDVNRTGKEDKPQFGSEKFNVVGTMIEYEAWLLLQQRSSRYISFPFLFFLSFLVAYLLFE